MTAAPSPTAVATFFETAKYEHMPKKTANTILSIKIDLKNNSMCSIIVFYLSSYYRN
jgi:3-phenylpropionate/cinnamic acid dioxygenase small subunit